MSDFESLPPDIQELVVRLQEEVRGKAQMIRETFDVIDGGAPFLPDSDADYAFRGGVEAGMAAMMQALHDRGWLQLKAL